MKDRERIARALELAVSYGGIDGAHHKAWVIDQMVRALLACPKVKMQAMDGDGKPYEYDGIGESPEYIEFVKDACAGEDGPETHTWDVGIPP